MRRQLVRMLLAGAVLASLPACSRDDSDLDDLRAALTRSKAETVQFIYTDERPDERFRVAGVMEDDFRFKALVSVGAAPTYEEVVSDDGLALRFLDPTRLSRLVDVGRAASADRSTELAGADVATVLQSGRWLLDVDGAPPIAAAFAETEDLGKDPVFDAITSLDYVERAVNQAQGVQKWSEDSLDPAYRKSEDSFPKPETGSGVVRYDLRRPRLPAAADLSGGADGRGAGLPGTRHFRKMAIYVKDGRILRVLERIEVTGKAFDDLRGYFDSLLRESLAAESVLAQAKAGFEAASRAPNGGALVLRGLSTIVEALGQDPILIRNMTLELDRGKNVAEVLLPTENTVKGSLDAFVISRAAKTSDPNATGPSAGQDGGGETTEPAPADAGTAGGVSEGSGAGVAPPPG